MPYKSEKISINNSKLDKRVKIQTSQYEEIKELYASGEYSLRCLGKLYGVDKGTISKIVNLEQAKRIREQGIRSSIAYRERLREDSELKEIRNKHMREYRARKHEFYKNGLIGNENNRDEKEIE